MAIFRLEARILSRAKTGRSVVAAAAYRAGMKLRDAGRDQVFDYGRRLRGVLATQILAPEGAPGWVFEPQSLWNHVERSEKRRDSQVARDFVLALPKELSAAEQFQLAVDWARKELVASGMVAHVCLHMPKDGKNPHAHILCPLRTLDGDQFSAKKPREWNDVKMLIHQRQSWCEAENSALEKAGRPERVDHRSLKDRGIDRIPEPKIGVAATAMKKRGAVIDPERFKLVRRVRMLNELRPMMRSMCERGEMPTWETTSNWLQKSTVVVSQVIERAREMMKGAWERFIGERSKDRTPLDVER